MAACGMSIEGRGGTYACGTSGGEGAFLYIPPERPPTPTMISSAGSFCFGRIDEAARHFRVQWQWWEWAWSSRYFSGNSQVEQQASYMTDHWVGYIPRFLHANPCVYLDSIDDLNEGRQCRKGPLVVLTAHSRARWQWLSDREAERRDCGGCSARVRRGLPSVSAQSHVLGWA
jgi:hypothetical protein